MLFRLNSIGLGFLDATLKGFGQVFLQENSYTGFFFLVGIFYNSIHFGIAALIGTIVSTFTGILLKQDQSQVRAGLFGFNGALTGIALIIFLQPSSMAWIYLIAACAGSTVLMIAMIRLLSTWKLPTLTAPFVFTTFIFLFIGARLGHFQFTHIVPWTATTDNLVTISTIIEGLFKGIAQVFFQNNAVTGGFFALGLLISSRRVCALALIGSLTGLLIAWGMGAAEPVIRSGVFGFNSVLTAVALGCTFFVFNTASAVYTLFAAIVTVGMSAVVSAALVPLGMPGLTLPFVLVVWIFILASSRLPQLIRNGQ